ncbi:MAG: ABC transporter permease [Opitutales bacterium]|nr:ABC transporter permease [Opitutales bacterium]MCH8540508.1 ABC transporter permease [Opitutales bacterium]
MHSFIHFLNKAGFGWLVPVVRLCAGDAPREQGRQILRLIVAPIAAIIVFLMIWAVISSKLETNLGALPGPGAVWEQTSNLWTEHREQRQARAEFYERQEERKAVFQERFPDREWQARDFRSSPTFIDQIYTSLQTVFTGFFFASVVAIPLGILCGLSKTFYTSINPLIQIFKPVSPLAWLPIVMILVSSLYTTDDPFFTRSFLSSAIVVALCSLWPTLINTAVGVASIDRDHLNVAKVLKLGWAKKVWKIVIPSSLPYIFTGLRLSLGVGWMVLIAAEMLAQSPGLGLFVWDMYQSSSSQTLALIMVAVLTIGILGFMLDRIMLTLQQLVTFEDKPAT